MWRERPLSRQPCLANAFLPRAFSTWSATKAREASQSPMVRVIPTLTGLPPPAGAGENSRLTPMYDLRSVAVVAAVLLCE